MNVGGSWTIDVEVMKRPPKNAVSEAWGQSKTLDFLFFVNRDVDGVRLKYCVNFYENQASETSKIKIGVFLFYLPQIPLRALDFESLQKKTWPEPQCLKGFFCAEKRAYLKGAIGLSEKHLWWTNGCRLDLFYLKQLRGFQGSSFSFTIWGIGAVWWTFPLNVQWFNLFPCNLGCC